MRSSAVRLPSKYSGRSNCSSSHLVISTFTERITHQPRLLSVRGKQRVSFSSTNVPRRCCWSLFKDTAVHMFELITVLVLFDLRLAPIFRLQRKNRGKSVIRSIFKNHRAAYEAARVRERVVTLPSRRLCSTLSRSLRTRDPRYRKEQPLLETSPAGR